LPVTVSSNDYCFGEGRCCGHFDGEGGYPTCGFHFLPLKYDENSNVPKPAECKNLKERK